MPAENEQQANFMRLVMYYKKHHRMPPGAGKPTKKIKEASKSMSYKDLSHMMHTKKG